MAIAYSALPRSEKDGGLRRSPSIPSIMFVAVIALVLSLSSFILGYAIGQNKPNVFTTSEPELAAGALLPPQSFIPKIPTKEVTFDFPSPYEDTGPDGDELWNQLMPNGAGFIRVPYPRRFNMPDSEPIQDDEEQGEVYSLSVSHQLHCLAVLRDVMIKYEKHDKSRFAGDGHEYHCLDYVRQAILCAGDTTLDYANDRTIGPDGKVTRYGFTGANSTHQCRDWDAIKAFAEQNRSGDRRGILV